MTLPVAASRSVTVGALPASRAVTTICWIFSFPNLKVVTSVPLDGANAAGTGVVNTKPDRDSWRTMYLPPPGSGPTPENENAPPAPDVAVVITAFEVALTRSTVNPTKPESPASCAPLPFASLNTTPLNVTFLKSPKSTPVTWSAPVSVNGAG